MTDSIFKQIETPQELDSLCKLVQEIWPEVFLSIIGKEQLDYMLEHYQGKDKIASEMEQGVRYFLIQQNKTCIGYFAYLLKDEFLVVSKVYLKKEYRGRGISSGVFAYLTETAKNNNKQKLFLRVNRGNKQAIDVYLHKGFSIVKSVDEPLGERFFLNDYCMEMLV